MPLQFVQYLLLTPTYLNILNVYAFCNTHDITWGTKGDDKAEKLPTADLKNGKVTVNLPTDDGDLNDQYDREMRVIAQKPPKEVKVLSAADKQEDYYKGFRSAVVLVWIFSNLGLAAIILSTGLDQLNVTNPDQTEEQRAVIYMKVILYSVAALSLFRFIGACWFLIVRLVSPSSPISMQRGFVLADSFSLAPWSLTRSSSLTAMHWRCRIQRFWVMAFSTICSTRASWDFATTKVGT